MSMIKGSWATTRVVCGNHGEDLSIDMIIESGPHSMFYACPKYRPENREKCERACFNRINFVEYENMLTHIADMLVEADENGTVFDLTNHSWEKKGIEYKVISHSSKEMVVSVLNKKALSK